MPHCKGSIVSRLPVIVLTRLFAGLLVLAAVVVGPSATRAMAAETVETYVVQGAINADGSLNVTATITFDGAAPATLARLAAASGAEFAFVSSLSPRSHVYRLRCSASDPGCGRALAALKAQPSVDYLSPDTLKDSR